jgi:hypothetical protein
VKKVFATVLGIAVLAVLAVVLLPRLMRDPEVSNAADREDASIAQPPEFFVSDPGLLHEHAHRIQDRQIDLNTNKPVPGGPYFVRFADGRYAFGYADDDGRTKALFTDRAAKYDVLWYDDALAEWQRVRAHPSYAR